MIGVILLLSYVYPIYAIIRNKPFYPTGFVWLAWVFMLAILRGVE